MFSSGSKCLRRIEGQIKLVGLYNRCCEKSGYSEDLCDDFYKTKNLSTVIRMWNGNEVSAINDFLFWCLKF